jgi:glyoxylase-like metal-dependent hydrolase (beta-lactamase superfamily II)
MKKNVVLMSVWILISVMVHGLEIKLDAVNENVTLVRGIIRPDYTQNLIVIDTDAGLIAIDTGFPLDVAQRMKAAIVKKLGRDDFIYLINTHGHMDHSIGNQLYKNAIKIAHVNAAREMRMNMQRWNKKYFTKPFNLTLPDITFKKFLQLKVDEITLNLYYPGVSHTDSHILINIPEYNILCVGDCFHSKFPPYVNQKMDLVGMINTMDMLAENLSPETRVLPGHREMFGGEYMKATLSYLKSLVREVRSAQQQGLPLEKARKLIGKRVSRKGLEKVQHWTDGKDVEDIFAENINTAWDILKN